MKTQEQLIQEAFAFYNGGKGLDHWSYSVLHHLHSQKI
jgi:hypothetical protein